MGNYTEEPLSPAPTKKVGKFAALWNEGKYSVWVLFLLLLGYLTNQLDRYALGMTKKEMQARIGFTDEQYDSLAGPAFIVVYTFAGIVIGFFSDRVNRRNVFAFAVFFWSACTALMGSANTFTQLVALRVGQGIGQAACNPVANGLIAVCIHYLLS